MSELVQQAKELFQEQLLPKIKQALELRDGEAKKLQRLEAARLEALSDVDRLEAELASAEIAAGERVSLGQDVKSAFAGVGKIRYELADQRARLNQLDQSLIPAAKTSFRESRAAALEAATSEMRPLIELWGSKMQVAVDEFVALVDAWETVSREFYGAHSLSIEPMSSDFMPKTEVSVKHRGVLRHVFC